MLDARNVAKSYPTRDGELVVVRDATLQVAAGEAAVIVGPSGSGKSTLLNIFGALDTPSSGTVRVADEDPFRLSDRDLARFRNRRIGFVFQDHHLLPQCSAIENVLLPTLASRSAGQPSANSAAENSAPAGSAANRARDLLTRVGLAERIDHRPAELSGGERQRVALARALIQRPALLLADEPTGNLDRRNAERIADLLRELLATERFALVLVTHSEQIAARFDRRYELDDGRLVPLPAATRTAT